jgi:hypothetical protein
LHLLLLLLYIPLKTAFRTLFPSPASSAAPQPTYTTVYSPRLTVLRALLLILLPVLLLLISITAPSVLRELLLLLLLLLHSCSYFPFIIQLRSFLFPCFYITLSSACFSFSPSLFFGALLYGGHLRYPYRCCSSSHSEPGRESYRTYLTASRRLIT